MKKFYLLIGFTISLFPSFVNAELFIWVRHSPIGEYMYEQGYYDGDPNQNEILIATEDYVIIRNITAPAKIQIPSFEAFSKPSKITGYIDQYDPAAVFIYEADNYCTADGYYNDTESVALDSHTVFFYCTWSFVDTLGLTSDDLEYGGSALMDYCLKYPNTSMAYHEKYCPNIMQRQTEMYPSHDIAKLFSDLQTRKFKFEDPKFLYELKSQVFAKHEEKKTYENGSTIIPASSGTGFFITDAGHIITNNHVIDYCDEIKVHYLGNEQKISLVASDLVNDLALLKSEITPENIFAIASEDINLLEEIYIAGFPFGKAISSSIKVTKGVVSSLSGVGDNYSNMQVDAALQPGNSGGPIIDENGNVVGVAVAKLDFAIVIEMFDAIPENTNFGIKSSVLNTFIKANNISLAAPSDSEISKSEISQKITNATVYLDCWMSKAKIQELSSQKIMFKYIK